MTTFTLTTEQQQQIADWMRDTVDPIAIEHNRKNLSDSEFNELTQNGTMPYAGAIGGRLTYEFTPTSLGTVIKVRDGLTGEHLDLTNYSEW